MPSTQEIFRTLISLTGRKIEVALRSSGKTLHGRVANAMFDSFLLEESGTRRVIAFSDILFLEPLPE